MSVKIKTSEAHVLELLKNQNKPFNAQVVSDFLAQHGVKKAQVQKALDSLAERNQITMKASQRLQFLSYRSVQEFGKVRIYWPIQNKSETLSKEETEQKKKELEALKEIERKETEELAQMQKEFSELTSALTLEEIESDLVSLTQKREELTEKISKLKDGPDPISPEERLQLEKTVDANVKFWEKMRTAFKEIWGDLSGTLQLKKSETFEEIGIDIDQEEPANLEEIKRLISTKRRRLN